MHNLHLDVKPDDRRMFERVFNLKFSDYFDGIFGFDIIKLDDHLKTPNGISMADYIKQQHGQEAVDLIQRLIDIM